MSNSSGDAKRALLPEKLAVQFQRGLEERLELAAAQALLGAEPEARSRVRSLAHALKGTYGFPEISGAAAVARAAAGTPAEDDRRSAYPSLLSPSWKDSTVVWALRAAPRLPLPAGAATR